MDDEPKSPRNKFDTELLRGDTPNVDSLPREPKRPTLLVDLEQYTNFKKILSDRKKINSFQQSSGNYWDAEGKRLKEIIGCYN